MVGVWLPWPDVGLPSTHRSAKGKTAAWPSLATSPGDGPLLAFRRRRYSSHQRPPGQAQSTRLRHSTLFAPVSDRTQLEQNLDAMALNLFVAAITLWNTAYLDRALQAQQQE